MAKQRVTQALDSLLRSALRLDRNLSVKDRFWLWRSSLLSRPANASTQAGFILPTVTLLLLMLSLVLGVLIFRTSNRTNQVIGARQQRQIYNAATPAVERAKLKLEYLFTKESIPVLPTEDDLISSLTSNPLYNLEGEEKLDIDGDGNKDAAWKFNYDSKGDKNSDTDDVTVAYSILSRASRTTGTTTISLDSDDKRKADNLVVRNGPINLTGGAGNPNCPPQARSPYQGWQSVTGAQLRKALQVHAFAIAGPNNPSKTAVATLEMQQDKQANLGNKWGAWFRTDMEIFPGPTFRWNGAMNTGGSYFITRTKTGTDPNTGGPFATGLYPISAPSSCVFTKDSSEIVMSLIPRENKDALNAGETFQGQLVVGSLRDNNLDGSFSLYGFDPANPPTTPIYGDLTKDEDSTNAANNPIDLALEPVVLQTEGINRRRDDNQDQKPETDGDAADKRVGAWAGRAWVKDGRLVNEYQPTPFVDDTYRADDRWGPKPVYNPELKLPNGTQVADPTSNQIPASTTTNDNPDRLTRAEPLATAKTDEEGYGLDGYWERRARAQGVRLIVGQRLELGNAHGWKTEVDANNDGDTVDAGDVDLNNNGLLDFDPLYPPPANPGIIAAATPVNGSMAARQHELMQWKTLRNNPAAAQSTAVYHYLMDKGRYPTACLASAAHPGTKASIAASTTFNRVTGKLVPNVSFLTGEGTNGWEFAPFGAATYADNASVGSALTTAQLTSARGAFATAVDSDTNPLRIALSNLAYFSGDLAGAFPAFQDTDTVNAAGSTKFRTGDELDTSVGPKTHPYPILTMWGDYSNLRRVINKLDGGPGSGGAATYDQLSLADQTTLQTASCTLGILAYNIETETAGTAALGRGAATALYRKLNALNDKNRTNGEIEVSGSQISVWKEGSPATGGTAIYTASAPNPTPADVPLEVIADALPSIKAQLLALQKKEQINRDRLMGFSSGSGYRMVGNQLGGVLGMPITLKGQTVTNLQCDFDGNKYFNQGKPRRVSDEQRFLTLAYAICPRSAKYPSLYYLFPKENHDHVGNTPSGNRKFLQPTTEPYTSESLKLNGADFDNRYAQNGRNPTTAKGANIGVNRFRVVAAAGACGTDCDSLKDIALVPKTKAAWALPTQANANGSNVIKDAVTTGTSADVSIAMLDKGIFNGREQMGLRTLDIDLDLLRKNTITGSGQYQNTDYWLPLPVVVDPDEAPTRTGAALYAFREDAVREDGIARPRLTSPSEADWKSKWREFSLGTRDANYVMNAAAFNTTTEKDPPASPVNGISPKPVDYHADPARRPHGFRLSRGIDLRRAGADEKDGRGMSFVSDNAVYIKGDFNVHRSGTEIIQEYTDELDDTWSNFYTRVGDDLDNRFARPESDDWRATEIVTDAIHILSDDFTDGWIGQGILNANGTGGGTGSSFRAMNYPNRAGVNALSWVSEDGRLYYANNVDNRNNAIRDKASPVKISQRGLPVYCSIPGLSTDISTRTPALTQTDVQTSSCTALGGEEREYGLRDTAQGFLPFATKRAQLQAADGANYVNALVVSGIVPSRVNQANGGLHNFPRTIESWEISADRAYPLWFAGSMFQLNFSHSSTGPYDQDAWEPGTNPIAGASNSTQESIWYFRPPDRRWGYDVALQYVQATPVAQRFSGRSNIRSEFYQELPSDDPYIVNLRCAKLNNKTIDPSVQNNGICN